MEKATHSLSCRNERSFKTAFNEEGRSLCDFEPTSSEYLFEEKVNENLKLAKGNYKLSQNLVKSSTKSRNNVAGPLSRTGFKRRPDHEAGSSFPSRNQQSLNYQGQKKAYASRTPQFQNNIKSRRY